MCLHTLKNINDLNFNIRNKKIGYKLFRYNQYNNGYEFPYFSIDIGMQYPKIGEIRYDANNNRYIENIDINGKFSGQYYKAGFHVFTNKNEALKVLEIERVNVPNMVLIEVEWGELRAFGLQQMYPRQDINGKLIKRPKEQSIIVVGNIKLIKEIK